MRFPHVALFVCTAFHFLEVEAYRKELADAYAKVSVAGASLTGAKVLAP
jgi:hypothetical protein